MDLAKFLWCLQHEALFFARLDQLGDPFEGYYTRIHAEGEDAFVNAIIAAAPDQPPEPLREAYRRLLTLHASFRTQYFVSSWYMNEQDSAAMWRLYTSLHESICITTSYANLYDALPEKTHMGIIRYIDYNRVAFSMFNSFNFVMHKRESYSHEREVRAVLWAQEGGVKGTFAEKDNGLIVPVDLGKVIESVYVSPSAKPMVREVVEGLVHKYELKARVLQSEVNASPAY